MRLEEIGAGAQIVGLDADGAAQILAAKWIGRDALDVAYRVGQHTRSRMVLRADEVALTALAETASPFALDGDAAVFRLAAEATRIRLAHLFDPYQAIRSRRPPRTPCRAASWREGLTPDVAIAGSSPRAWSSWPSKPRLFQELDHSQRLP